MLTDKSILITGGTGSFGKAFVRTVLERYPKVRRLVIFSRDELKQYEMQQVFSDRQYPCLRYFLGDVRDESRLRRALEGIDVVVHAAALKQVPAAEYNPFECIKTNVLGAQNLIEACLSNGVQRVVALSTDKAAAPINLYGATKLCAEKLFVQGNAYSGDVGTSFSCVRYGNVVGSRGSVIPLFEKQRATGKVTVTDRRMTRFWITLDQGVRFVIGCIERMHGGEVFVPKIPSMNIMDLATAIAPGCTVEDIGIRPGEKLHEVLLSEDEARDAIELDDMFVVEPSHPWWNREAWTGGARPAEGYRYASDSNTWWLSVDELKAFAGPGEA